MKRKIRLLDIVVLTGLSISIGLSISGLFLITKLSNELQENQKEEDEPTIIDAVNYNIVIKFYADYGTEDYTIITLDTKETYNHAFITEVLYHIDFDNNVYSTTYVSYLRENNEFESRQIKWVDMIH